MKKTAAILLMGIFLFNWIGYRLLTSFMEDQANNNLLVTLDNNNYRDSDLISIKLPASLPSYTNSKHYTRVDGEVELNGIHYNFVKYRIYKS